MVFNLSELHKAHVLHHWRLVGIPMISQQVKYADEGTVANCYLYNHPFQNLYEMKESGDAEKTLFVAVTRKHQTEADHVIGGIGTAAAVTMLRDALCPLPSSLCVCLACAAPALDVRYQRREDQKMVQITTSNDAHATSVLPAAVALAGVGRVETPESQTMLEGIMSAASSGQIETDSTC